MKFFSLLFFIAFISSVNAETIDADAMLAAHNKWRVQTGLDKLSYSEKLAKTAQIWANELRDHHACQMMHSKSDGSYGENIFWSSALRWSSGKREVMQIAPAKAVDSWASEKADYDYASNRCTPGKMCGHYTQLVWKDTKQVGCAIAVCPDSKDQVWVCQYQPAGNWIGQKPY